MIAVPGFAWSGFFIRTNKEAASGFAWSGFEIV
jgi:hypothetical protein